MRSILMTVGLFCTLAASAQETPLPHPGPIRFDLVEEEFTHWAHAVFQDSRGYMWFGLGSRGGVARLDGHEHVRYRHSPLDSTSIPYGDVYSILESRDGTMWFGMLESVAMLDQESGSFTRYAIDPEETAGFSTGSTHVALQDSKDRLWFGTQAGLSLLDRETGTFSNYYPSGSPSEEVPGPNSIAAIHEDAGGGLWLGSGAGLLRFAPESGEFRAMSPSGIPPADFSVCCIEVSDDGRWWLGATTHGVYVFDRANETFRHFPMGDGTSYQVTQLARDPDGGLWVGSNSRGLLWLDPASGLISAYTHDPLDPESIADNRITNLFGDRQGVFWVGARLRGMQRFDRTARPFLHIKAAPQGVRGLVSRFIIEVAEAPDGSAWVLNGGSGETVLTRVDLERQEYRHYRPDPGDPGALKAARRVFVTSRGEVLVSNPGYFARMDPARPGRFIEYPVDRGDPRGPFADIICMFEDRAGQLWLVNRGSPNYIVRVDDLEKGLYATFDLGVGTGVDEVVEDHAGYLWMATGQGLIRLDPDTGDLKQWTDAEWDSHKFLQGVVLGIFERPEEPGILWLGLYPFGLGRFDVQAETLELFSTESGIADPGVQAVYGDDNGRLWTATDYGISSFDPKTRRFTNYDVDDGLQGASFGSVVRERGKSGRLYFGGRNGLNAFHPEVIRGNPNPPQVVIQGLKAGKSEINAPESVVLPFRDNDITVRFAGLHFRHPEGNRFTHFLEGHDDTWSDTTAVRQASYSNLPPGEYTFRVSASNSDHVWSPEGASLAIRIRPPWYQTVWAYAVYALLVGGGGVWVDRTQRARIVRREREATRERELEQAREIEAAYTKLKATQAQLIEQEKLASLGALTAGIAHEIKNPLNFVNNFAEVSVELADEVADAAAKGEDLEPLIADLRQNSEQIARHGRRADDIVRSMMQHARGGTSEAETVSVNAFVEEYVNLAWHGARAKIQEFQADIVRDYAEDAGTAEVLPQELGRVMLNLLGNAFDAVQRTAGARITVSTARLAGQVQIRVADNGPGIPAEIRERIFEPFFTTKPTGEGTGLGLSLSYDIVTKGHGGTMTVADSELGGAEFAVSLPA